MNELEKRANKHKKKQDGLSPFCSLGERLDRKSIDKNRIDIARLLGIPSGGIIVSENGRVEIHNIPEDDARRYSNVLRNKVKDIRLIPGKYDFKKIPMPGQMPNRLVTISGMLNDSLNEDILLEKTADVERSSYKGHEMVAEYTIDAEEGNWSFAVTIYRNGKPVPKPTNEFFEPTTFESFKAARAWIDKNAKKCSLEDKLNQICAYIRQSSDYSEDELRVAKDEYGYYILDRDYQGDNWHIYVKSNYAYDVVNCKNPGEWEYMSVEEFEKLIKEYPEYFDGIEYSIDDDSVSCELEYHEAQKDLYAPFIGSPFSMHQYEGCSLYDFVERVLEIYGDSIDKDNEFLVDEYDCSIPESLTEARKKKKKRLGGTLNPDAGNVEHNINMFNHMNNPTDGPSNNPVSGPFGGDVSAPSSDGCCESLKKRFIEGMRLTNGMREDEHYYFDDGNYSYHFFSKVDRYGITNQFAVLVVDYGFEFHYDQMYKDEKTGVDTIPVTMRHDKPKKICYFEFDENTQPDIVDAFLDDDMVAFRNAVKAAAEKEIEKNPLNETKLKEAATKTVYRAEYYEPKLDKWVSYYENSDVEKVKSHKDDPIFGNPKVRVSEYTVSGVRKPSYKFVKLVESVEQKEKYYTAKYRGVNTDRLHKVYFSCDGDFEDAENLLDELIAEPYTSARVLGTVSKAEAERDGFTKIGGTSGKELDDDFNMSTRTLW